MGYTVALIAEDTTAAEELASSLKAFNNEVTVLQADEGLAAALADLKPQRVIPLCNGIEVRSLCEVLEIPAVGSSAEVCRLAQASSRMVDTMEYAYGDEGYGSTFPVGTVISKKAFAEFGLQDAPELIASHLPAGYPLAVKAAQGHAVCGVVKAESDEELVAALAAVFSDCPEAVVEEWVEGVVMQIPVLAESYDSYALPAVEIADGQVYAPVRLESLSHDEQSAQAIRSEAERVAAEVHEAYGCKGMSVVTAIWDGGAMKVVGLDACPDLSGDGILAQSCQVCELTVPAVLNELLDL